MGFHYSDNTNQNPVAVALVSRPKQRLALGDHYGSAFLYADGSERVSDHSREPRPDWMSVDEFCAGHMRSIHNVEYDPQEIKNAMARHAETRRFRNPEAFDVLTWNCEHSARYTCQGRAQSHQVQGVGFLLALCALLYFAESLDN